MRLIDADALYEQLKQDEEMARNRVLDTKSSLPWPNYLNPSYTRYVAQMDERTRLKHMVADAPIIEERKKGKWVKVNGKTAINCSACYHCSWSLSFEDTVKRFNYCPNCGARMEGKDGDENG